MKNKPIIIVPGEINSIFFEIFFKILKKRSFKSPLILISSTKIYKAQAKKFKFKKKVKFITFDKLKNSEIDNKSLNLLNITNSKNYLENSFDAAFKILKSGFTNKFINGPVDKTIFLRRKYLGMTEYISKKFKTKNTAMLIFNKDLSVCPLTTHLPLKLVTKNISKKLIFQKTSLINKFYLKNIGIKPKIAVTGLNPHCESILKFNEDKKIISPAINSLKKIGINIDGPFSADTIFLKQNRKKYDVILGMYHDQVLTPLKTLKEYDAINITLGLPFLRVSPDHGPNKKMINKNLSNPLSLLQSIKFLDKLC